MSEGAVIKECAAALEEAARTRVPIGPPSRDYPGLSIADSYAIQSRLIGHRVAAGATASGRKIGLTARPMQEMLGVNEPDFGILLDDMFTDDGGEISLSTLLQPRIEAEIAIVLGQDLRGPGVTVSRALATVAGLCPSLEIVDSRVADWNITIVDTIADNASSGRVVLGGTLVPVGGVDPRLIGMVLKRNGQVVETGAGAAALGNPIAALAWLANTLAPFDEGLSAGDVVLPGALHRMVPVQAGDSFCATFSELGPVSVRFVP